MIFHLNSIKFLIESQIKIRPFGGERESEYAQVDAKNAIRKLVITQFCRIHLFLTFELLNNCTAESKRKRTSRILHFLKFLDTVHRVILGGGVYTAGHQVLTYVEYRAVSGVFQNIPHPVSTQRVCHPPAPKEEGW